MSKLLAKMLKAGSIQSASVLDESAFFNARDLIPTNLPILNVAFSGDIDGGFTPGLTILAGLSKSFKTMLSLYCLKAYQDKYPDAVCLFYDNEFGSNSVSFQKYNIDTSRIIHIPLEHVEQMKFDMVQRLKEIEKGDRVFILVDSLGNLASKKEVEDAEKENSAADMSRAKAIRSFLRIITPHLTMKDLPCFIINHVYSTQELYSKTVIPGGTAVTYSANQIFVITKAQEKEGDTLAGWRFTLNIEKSRFIKEKSKLTFTAFYDEGIRKWSGLIDIAMEGGYIVKPKQGWYAVVDRETGEVLPKNYRFSDLETNDEVWKYIFETTDFKAFVKEKYTLEV